MLLFLSRRFASKTPAQMLNRVPSLQGLARAQRYRRQSKRTRPTLAHAIRKSIRRAAGGGETDQSLASQ